MRTANETLIESDLDDAKAGLRLIAFHGDVIATFALPESGAVVIGRGEDADLRLDLPPISRRHARLHLGAGVEIEDLGSSNGTRVRGQPLAEGERVRLGVGDPVEFGSVLVLIQRDVRTAAVGARPRRVWGHEYFDARVEEECLRAEQDGRPFAVARVKLPPPSDAASFVRRLGDFLRPIDVVAAWGPGEYELLLVAQSGTELERRIDTLKPRLSDALVGAAQWPKDGRTADALLEHAARALRERDAQPGRRIIEDAQMRALYELVPRIAASDISVLVLGETGVGKELLAEALHNASPRAARPLVRLNCGAFTETLLESELFGHEKGSFTGAVKSKPGLLEVAEGGTVFLDEVGEMPLSTQVKLLRVIEQREVMRVGDVRPRKIDVRFVAATNRDPEAEVKAGRFRQDLYFRLNGISLRIPSLRERRAEIPILAEAFAQESARRMNRPPPRLTAEAMELLTRYSWPGNVRELRNVMERAVVLAPDQTLTPEELPLEKMSATVVESDGPAGLPDDGGGRADDERRRIEDALEKCAGNQTLAAKLLGISRRTLVNRLDAYHMPRPRKRTTTGEG